MTSRVETGPDSDRCLGSRESESQRRSDQWLRVLLQPLRRVGLWMAGVFFPADVAPKKQIVALSKKDCFVLSLPVTSAARLRASCEHGSMRVCQESTKMVPRQG
jgi:hypothetical protein